jgi:ribosomal protein S19E (S16A)
MAQDVSQAMYTLTRSTVTPLMEKHGLDQLGFFYFLMAARSFEPDPLSVARLVIRGPYTNPAQYAKGLAELAEVGHLKPLENDEYRLSAQGRAALREITHAIFTRLGEIPALPEQDMSQLANLLDKLVQASLEAQEPDSKWCITKSHNMHPDQEYAPLAQIDQHIDDLGAFRDDAHLAAWKPYGVSGPAWEAITFLWRGEVHTVQELIEKIPYRKRSAETYTQGLEDMIARGWMEKVDEGYQLTQQGQALRQQAEDETDRYFFAPWACLDSTGNAQLHDLLTQLKDKLQEMVEDTQEAA